MAVCRGMWTEAQACGHGLHTVLVRSLVVRHGANGRKRGELGHGLAVAPLCLCVSARNSKEYKILN